MLTYVLSYPEESLKGRQVDRGIDGSEHGLTNGRGKFHLAQHYLLYSRVHFFLTGFITDGNSKLVGNARIRQLRVQRNSCQVAGSMQQLVSGCYAPYSWEGEDMGSYGPGWNYSTRNQTASMPSPWKYQTQAELRAYPVWGKVSLYRGGGFAAELGPDLRNASR